MKLTRYDRNPILAPDPTHEWESLVTTNPGAWYDAAQKRVLMLYRAAGNDSEHVVRLALATSNDGYHFERPEEPVFCPSQDGFDAGCVEDPRIVRMGDTYFITYAARPYPPGEYWLSCRSRYRPPVVPRDYPYAFRTNATSSGLLITRDFRSFIRAGRLTDPTVDDRDVILFPEKIGGKFFMLHRPMEWVGNGYGTQYPGIWIAHGDDLLEMRHSKLLASAKYDWETKLGGNTPPIRTDEGWLTIFHSVGPDAHYRLGAMLLDIHDPTVVRHRTPDWILQPEMDYELEGPYRGCVFPCGKVVIDETLFVYYGAADKYVALATCPLATIVDHLLTCPS
jgi:beta-1,2-mannobiose phosphorylase / 1,2-beta-oligomannan phosphorylase